MKAVARSVLAIKNSRIDSLEKDLHCIDKTKKFCLGFVNFFNQFLHLRSTLATKVTSIHVMDVALMRKRSAKL